MSSRPQGAVDRPFRADSSLPPLVGPGWPTYIANDTAPPVLGNLPKRSKANFPHRIDFIPDFLLANEIAVSNMYTTEVRGYDTRASTAKFAATHESGQGSHVRARITLHG